ncbi:MAG: hypothetical protein GX130_07405 [Candidatus Hydrogenedens sp.]|jgi:predicted metal-dependent peptidase|nr:hypothetical protein [Candidatus Hydrogenedens sp.]
MKIERGSIDAFALEKAEDALRFVCIALPHLAGLAHSVHVVADKFKATVGVGPSGLITVNPGWFLSLSLEDAMFVMAHELMHLALRHHDRFEMGVDRQSMNVAADYIINDMLMVDLGRCDCPPADALYEPGARRFSLEELIIRNLDKGGGSGEVPGQGPAAADTLQDALTKAFSDNQGASSGVCTDDLLSEEEERSLCPDWTPRKQESLRKNIKKSIMEAKALGAMKENLEKVLYPKSRGTESGNSQAYIQSIATAYRPPWEQALQRWMESTAPGPRSYSRPSRRGADRSDVVLPGRSREGWTLNIILDTSGSMVDDLSKILGIIASFCVQVNVQDVRLLQCDVEVTADERVTPEDLADFIVRGMGGSDMSPAMELLAKDFEVTAVIVITDGYIDYPSEPMPYEVLWVITDSPDFQPPYGQVIPLQDNGF